MPILQADAAPARFRADIDFFGFLCRVRENTLVGFWIYGASVCHVLTSLAHGCVIDFIEDCQNLFQHLHDLLDICHLLHPLSIPFVASHVYMCEVGISDDAASIS